MQTKEPMWREKGVQTNTVYTYIVKFFGSA